RVANGGPQTMAELLADAESEEGTLRPLRSGETVEGTVASISGDEVLVDLGGRSAGVLSLREANAALDGPLEPGDTVRALVGKDLTLKVIEVDEKRNRLILSEKAARQELRRQRKAQAAAQLQVGNVLEGTVTHVTGFGLFVDVGIADGLVHRSEITWD